ncbi:MAG TPA: malonyl-ACP O-methyltransferase BioC [Thiobacillaceae bacterium]|nr:malonyl-ACP O-methyltransferase BioC [Thiobacillaceae bacterium]HNU64820.1 malonyl-ACP O-methyltransferase BioC [Thiobacillaceae bacterium]
MPEARKRAVRRAFERAVATYAQSAFLQQEVARRLDGHLEEIRLAPKCILDAGCGTGFGVPLLRQRYPQARILALDLAHGMVASTRRQYAAPAGWHKWLHWAGLQPSSLLPLCADLEQLPLTRHSVDMVWSNLVLQWVDPLRALAEIRRVLRPGGLFLFSSLGPDTLRELRAASTDLDGHAHVNRFTDMHDVGDALVRAGLANPVMEMEHITLTYADLRGVLADIRGIGAHTVLTQGRAGLMGKQVWARLSHNYEAFRRDGRLPATYEVVYGHAWAAHTDRLADGRQIIQLQRGKREGWASGGR